jgi:hypothetical protein
MSIHHICKNTNSVMILPFTVNCLHVLFPEGPFLVGCGVALSHSCYSASVNCIYQHSCHSGVGGIPSESALPVSLHRRNPIRIGIAGKPSSEESHPNRHCWKAFIRGIPSESAVRLKSKKINEATRSNESRTLFGKK